MPFSQLLPAAAELAGRPRRVVRALAVLMLAALAVHVLYTSTGLGGSVADTVINRWGANVIYAAAAGLCALRVRSAPRVRGAWLALTLALGLFTAGDVYYSVVLYTVEDPPFPSPADAAWLAFYPAAYVCLGLIVRDSVRRFHRSVWLDGLVAALAVAGVGVALVVVPILSANGGTTATVFTNAAYPLGDLVLLSLTIGMVALHGWRGRNLLLLAAGFATFAAADSLYLSRIAAGTFHAGTVLDSLWLLGAALMALAAWQPPQRAGAALLGSGAMLVMPLGFGLGALTVLTVAGIGRVEPIAVALAAAAVAASMLRTAVSFRELRALAETRRQAATDELTDLPNRRAFDRSLQAAIQRAAERGDTLAVMVIDLDGFKELNDTLGHHAGDLVLAQVGPLLRSALRSEDLLARLGGDEFAVLLPGAEAAEAAGPCIAAALEHPFSIDGIELQVAASVGVALYPEHGTDAVGLMQRADVAMYVAKERRTGIEFYARERDRHTRERLELIADLRAAVHARELVVHYQPKIDLSTGDVTGAEALLRWPHPVRGLIPPSDFIPLAEQTGVIRPLTEFVLDEAVRQTAAWRAEGLELDIAVNVSATSLLDRGWTGAVTTTLAHHQLPARHLILEITESVIMADPDRSLAAVQALAQAGVRVSIDDFGIGYSSLAYLKDLPVAEIKVDRTFVRDLATDPADAAIVQAIVGLGQRLGIAVVAEGVEDRDALERLTGYGTDIAQGFYFSPPLAPDDFTTWLAERLSPIAA
jgi:diguanylate cyclase (GGDEF)-like protein